ncbi:uncharacterized protein EAF02_004132 [Botrytis sinoallii]|uniref:uncharacterized protein n=1 Tax=Botrytis sinoallii TaxID=1463999 RepID=UPI0018FF8547|nr:uncharacterized protein EAF02_004132 [Botrytis sinoallii]KAF7885623.1 hypothetical protein EAF02_004132 [Botrytis sinoallii]
MPQSRQPIIWGLGISFSIIAIAAVVLRFWARRIKGQNLGSDDWTILVALILGLSVTIDMLIMTQLGGLGSHSEFNADGTPLNPKAAIVLAKTIYALEVLTWPAVGMTKISVLLMYKRIFSTPRFQIVTWIMIGVNVAWILTFTFALMFSCLPIAGPWTGTEYKCVNQEILFTVALATDVATDCKSFCVSTEQETHSCASFGIFCLGGLVSIVGVVRIHFLTTIYFFLYSSHTQPDITWLYAPTYYWTIIETNVGVLSARLPTLRPILERVTYSRQFSQLTHLFSSSSTKTGDIRLGSVEDLNSNKRPSERVSSV